MNSEPNNYDNIPIITLEKEDKKREDEEDAAVLNYSHQYTCVNWENWESSIFGE